MFLAGISSGLKFGVYPAKITFNGTAGEKICEKVFLNSDRETGVSVEDHWNSVESRKIQDYELNSSYLGIIESYDKNFKVNGTSAVNICFEAKNVGVYYGALIFNAENGYASVGVWTTVNVKERENLFGISGNAINNFGKNVLSPNGLFVISFVLEVIVLLFLFKLVKKKREKNSELEKNSENEL